MTLAGTRPELAPWLKSKTLKSVPEEVLSAVGMPRSSRPLVGVWLSSRIMVQAFSEQGGVIRLSINRVEGAKQRSDGSPVWIDGLSWDDLQQIKRACGFGARWAVEVFPADDKEVNVANMRHLWLLPEPPPYGWK